MKFDPNLDRRNIGRFRIAVSTAPAPRSDPEPLPLKKWLGARAARSASKDLATLENPLYALYRTIDPEWRRLAAAVRTHAALEPRPEFVKALVCSAGLPAVRLHTQGPDYYEKTFFLNRGDLNQKEGEAPSDFLTVLTRGDETRWKLPPAGGARTPGHRAALARWITDTNTGRGDLLSRR